MRNVLKYKQNNFPIFFSYFSLTKFSIQVSALPDALYLNVEEDPTSRMVVALMSHTFACWTMQDLISAMSQVQETSVSCLNSFSGSNSFNFNGNF